jgi:hypothetical protein
LTGRRGPYPVEPPIRAGKTPLNGSEVTPLLQVPFKRNLGFVIHLSDLNPDPLLAEEFPVGIEEVEQLIAENVDHP